MPLHRKKIFRLPPPAPTTIYVRPGYNRVLAEEFEALKLKRAILGAAQFDVVLHRSVKLAILIGPHTACASEILTDSFQRYKRGVVVGRKSAGKTELGKFVRLQDDGAVECPYLDIADSSGVRFEKAPITPDIEVSPATLAEIRTGRDRDIRAALAALAGTGPSG